MIGAIVQARMGSTRLPGKIMADIEGRPMLWHVIDRVRNVKLVKDNIIIATTDLPADTFVVNFAKENKIKYFCGSEENLLQRYLDASLFYKIDVILRITSDNPLLDYRTADDLLALQQEEDADYLFVEGLPLGASTEVHKRSSLERVKNNLEHLEPEEINHYKEHVTPFFMDYPHMFKICRISAPIGLKRHHYKLTVDTPEDLRLIREIYKKLYSGNDAIEMRQVIQFLDKRPDLVAINSDIRMSKKLLRSIEDPFWGGEGNTV